MSNSNFSNNPGQENYRGRSNNERSILEIDRAAEEMEEDSV